MDRRCRCKQTQDTAWASCPESPDPVARVDDGVAEEWTVGAGASRRRTPHGRAVQSLWTQEEQSGGGKNEQAQDTAQASSPEPPSKGNRGWSPHKKQADGLRTYREKRT